MINLDKHEIDIQCPKCSFYNSIWLLQARLRDVIICRGCKSNIYLDDQMNETRKAIKSVRRAMAKFEKSLSGSVFKIGI